MKTITIAGRLGKNATLRRTQNGDPVLGFSVAVNDGYGDKAKTMWFECSWFGKRAEKIEQYLTKGTSVCVSGDLGTREYNGKTYLQVRVSELDLMGGGERRSDDTGADGYAGGGVTARNFNSSDLDDEIPF